MDLEAARAQAAVTRLIDAYREVGHYLADLDPLKLSPRRQSHELLELSAFGLTEADLDRVFYNRVSVRDGGSSTLRELIAALRETYCRTIGVEFMHIRDTAIRRWLLERMEPTRNRPAFDIRKKRRIIYKLNAAELFETFLHKNYVGQKRFSLEGGEMLIPLLDAIIERAGSLSGVREIVMGMPHRGRLNVLANTLDKPYGMIFNEFEGNLPETVGGDGDVKYHLGFSADHVTADKHTIHLTADAQPQPPRGGQPGGRGADAGQAAAVPGQGPPAGPADPDPRRRRLRRPGAGRRDPEPLAAARATRPAARSTSW